jgi:hypothetical protein
VNSIRKAVTARLSIGLNPRIGAATAESDVDLRELRNSLHALGARLSMSKSRRVVVSIRVYKEAKRKTQRRCVSNSLPKVMALVNGISEASFRAESYGSRTAGHKKERTMLSLHYNDATGVLLTCQTAVRCSG